MVELAHSRRLPERHCAVDRLAERDSEAQVRVKDRPPGDREAAARSAVLDPVLSSEKTAIQAFDGRLWTT
jgi:hypothetical protein